jgi:diphthine-ammonia ligase
MIDCQIDARIVKICSMGLKESHLGQSIKTLQPFFAKLSAQCGFNVCGEGGEFESVVLDCPLFKTHRIELTASEIVTLDKNEYAPVSYLRLTGL